LAASSHQYESRGQRRDFPRLGDGAVAVDQDREIDRRGREEALHARVGVGDRNRQHRHVAGTRG
jgi:hypothetical protein